MSSDLTLNPCGHSCSFCRAYQGKAEVTCQGCTESDGNPWWGVCKVFECSKEHSINHCGLCGDFPCDMLVTHYNPDNPVGQRNAIIRTGVLAYRARHNDEKAMDLAQKVWSLPD